MAIPLRPSGEAGEDRYQPLAEINVTPMVDVMLVLLIIFMVTAPLLTVGVPLDLPKTRAAELHQPKEPIVLSLDRDGGTVYRQRAGRRRATSRSGWPRSPRRIRTASSMSAAIGRSAMHS